MYKHDIVQIIQRIRLIRKEEGEHLLPVSGEKISGVFLPIHCIAFIKEVH